MKREGRNNIVVFCSDGTNSRLLVDFLSKNFNLRAVYIEPSESKFRVFKRRIKNIGLFKALGQVAFLIGVLPFMKNQKRTNEILRDARWRANPISKNLIQQINSINETNLAKVIEEQKVDLIFINGTSIISNKQLNLVSVPIINIHVGITPTYRGVHGGYWAIRDQKPELFGTTLHLVDQGIDTGGILAQKIIKPTSKDNFKTYPLLQYMGGIDLIEENLDWIKKGEIQPIPSIAKESKLHSHPTICQYLLGRLKGIK